MGYHSLSLSTSDRLKRKETLWKTLFFSSLSLKTNHLKVLHSSAPQHNKHKEDFRVC